MYDALPESIDHLFFQCPYSAAIPVKVLLIIAELARSMKCEKRTGDRATQNQFINLSYMATEEREDFRVNCITPAAVHREIMFKVTCKATDSKRLFI